MRSTVLLRYLILSLTFIFAGCTSNLTDSDSGADADTETGELPRALNKTEQKLVQNGQSFSFNIFSHTTAADDSENIFISPLSISLALGMTLNGADGETYQQMRETLALQDISLEDINSGYQSLIELLTTADPKVKMKIANSVWSDENLHVRDEFKQQLQEYFNAEVGELDFTDPESAEIINQWVAENTNELIDSIIDGEIPPGTVMYLINAIYFKGNWTYQFDEEKTRERTFTLENGDKIPVEMMHQESDFKIYQSDEIQMIDLPYGDSLFSMTIMMPTDPEIPLQEFIDNDFTQQNFNNWIGNLRNINMPLSLPKFEIEYEILLNDILSEMGMEDAFLSAKADFSRITPGAKLFISEVKHKTYVNVDEEGTEAAAVTSVGVAITSMPPSFNVNRPFVFVIREQNSGAILFMGKIQNPAV